MEQLPTSNMKHSLKVFLGLLSFVPFTSNVYGVDYAKITNFYILNHSFEDYMVGLLNYNIDTMYKKVTVKAYKMTTYFGEYVKESEYPIWEKTVTYNNAGYVASITNEAKDTHTIFRYDNNGILAKISTYYLSTGKLWYEKDTWSDGSRIEKHFWREQYYSKSDSYGDYRFCYERADHIGHHVQMLFNNYFNPDGIKFRVWCWGQAKDGSYFTGNQYFTKSESWLKQNGFQGVWKEYKNFKSIFMRCMYRENVYFTESDLEYYNYNEYGFEDDRWVLQRKDGRLVQAQDPNHNYCYEYIWSK